MQNKSKNPKKFTLIRVIAMVCDILPMYRRYKDASPGIGYERQFLSEMAEGLQILLEKDLLLHSRKCIIEQE